MSEDEENTETIYTTSEKNRINSGTGGPEKTETRGILLQVQAPVWMDDETVQKTIQEAIVQKTEEMKGSDDD